MGLFSRDKAPDREADNLFDDSDLPGSEDLDESFLADQATTELVPEPPPKPAARAYGIEDAIALMRKLPREDPEVVVTVVNKTLESIQIKVADIIADAASKEARLREQHKKLEAEIKDFQMEIELRNRRITELLADLKETSEVSQRLQLAVNLEKKNSPPPTPAAAEGKPPAAAARPSHPQAPAKEPVKKTVAAGAPAQPRPAPTSGESANTKF